MAALVEKFTPPASVSVIMLRGLGFPPKPLLNTLLRGREGISITTSQVRYPGLKPVVLSSVEIPDFTTIHPMDSFKLSLFLHENLQEDSSFFWDFPVSLYQREPKTLLEIFTGTIDILRGKRATAIFWISGEKGEEEALTGMLRHVDNVFELRRHESRVVEDLRGVYSLFVSKHVNEELAHKEYVLLLQEKEEEVKIVEPPGEKEYESIWKVNLPPLPKFMLEYFLKHDMVPARYKLEMTRRGFGRMLAFMGDGIIWATGSALGPKIISRSCRKVGVSDGKELSELLKITEPTVQNVLMLCDYAAKILGLTVKVEGNKIITTECPYTMLVMEAKNQQCCHICEEYRKGIAECLSPDLIYSMVRSMGRGDEFCEGVITKRGETKAE